MKISRLLAFSCFFSQAAVGQAFPAIDALAKCSDPIDLSKLNHMVFVAAHGDTVMMKQVDDTVATAKKCSDDALEPAVTAAAQSPDLRNAVKDLYVKGNAFIVKAGRPGQDRAQRERDEAYSRVKMEMQLAK